jgi:hypothetical protein
MDEVPLSPEFLVRAILARQPKGAYTRRLVKLSFLAEVAYAADKGRRLSSAGYIRDHYGPNSRELVEAALTLPENLAGCETDTSPVEPDALATRFIPTESCEPTLSPEQVDFLDRFMEAHRWESTQNLVDEARRTSLYLEAKFKASLDFDRWIARVQNARADTSYMGAIHAASTAPSGHTFNGILEVQEFLRGIQNPHAGTPA